jgi:hypothetical protein
VHNTSELRSSAVVPVLAATELAYDMSNSSRVTLGGVTVLLRNAPSSERRSAEQSQ